MMADMLLRQERTLEKHEHEFVIRAINDNLKKFSERINHPNKLANAVFGAFGGSGGTSIYGPFARANLATPGVRLKLKPGKTITSFIALRGYWLASDDDSWTTARINNIGNQSDSYIGSQIEARIRWDVVQKNIRLETGAALLFAGDLMDNAGKTDTSYVYSQLVFSF